MKKILKKKPQIGKMEAHLKWGPAMSCSLALQGGGGCEEVVQ